MSSIDDYEANQLQCLLKCDMYLRTCAHIRVPSYFIVVGILFRNLNNNLENKKEVEEFRHILNKVLIYYTQSKLNQKTLVSNELLQSKFIFCMLKTV